MQVPDTARFLSPDERELVQQRLPPTAARSSDRDFDGEAIKSALQNPLTYTFTFVQMFQNIGTYGL